MKDGGAEHFGRTAPPILGRARHPLVSVPAHAMRCRSYDNAVRKYLGGVSFFCPNYCSRISLWAAEHKASGAGDTVSAGEYAILVSMLSLSLRNYSRRASGLDLHRHVLTQRSQ